MDDYDPHMFLYAYCIGCGAAFTCSITKVPSLRVNGVKEPVCSLCFERRQKHREANGLPREPLMDGAYDPEPAI